MHAPPVAGSGPAAKAEMINAAMVSASVHTGPRPRRSRPAARDAPPHGARAAGASSPADCPRPRPAAARPPRPDHAGCSAATTPSRSSTHWWSTAAASRSPDGRSSTGSPPARRQLDLRPAACRCPRCTTVGSRSPLLARSVNLCLSRAAWSRRAALRAHSMMAPSAHV